MKIEDLQKDLKEVFESPVLKIISEPEKNKRTFLATESLAEMISGKNQEFENSIVGKSLAELEMKLSGYASIGKLNIDDSLGIAMKSALESIKANEGLLNSSKVLNSALGQIDTNIFKERIFDLEEQRKLLEEKSYISQELMNFELPKNPIYDVIEQNTNIIDYLDLQNESLNEIAKYLANQNEKLDKQNNITEQQIKESEKSAKKALWIATISIFISIVATFGAIFVSYDVYKKEDISDNMQHKELLQTIDKSSDSSEQNRVLNELLKEIKNQNKLLDSKIKTDDQK
ncbi:MAG: hypothetical protein KU37_04810 [Sulfuricurvum sp. PC08-66]|nr:MAG: hypothetical protein KU37_04810 [Sulfuricurvum sp. PC08-66]